MKGEVLVKARPRIQYDMSGKPACTLSEAGVVHEVFRQSVSV